MVNYRAPGVYVQEVPSGTQMFGQAGTNGTGFIGVAPNTKAPRDTVVTIDNWSQFVRIFVGEATEGTHLSTAVHGYFANGGGRAYVVNVGQDGTLTGTAAHPTGLTLLEAIDDVSIVVAPGFTDPADYNALTTHCQHPLRQDRMAILDLVEEVDDVGRLLEVGTSGVPVRPTSDGDTPGAPPPAAPPRGFRPENSEDGYTAAYHPWLVVVDPISGQRITTPPSGHMAGVWARTDASRGVHKAPANTNIAGALDLVSRVSKGDQELLNPAGINCIRFFPGEGILVWGARTLAPESSEFRYINVRRLTNMIKESVLDGTRWAVFEPNHHPLWAALRRDINAFLMNVWRDGALVGRTPQEAFFVKCDEETNPPEVRDAGMVVTIIGIAPVKPAEFVVFQLMQSADTSTNQTPGA
ncbi:phage tail sheath family protein [Tessaracoccus sp. SD287]|uniref:phage tail sheath family protein n=1 Tax=Tessaracoccus sp. SD287 TaxID=2782008 RepID=UPI001A97921D|nr:phage tail sheath C-terminal domain-containing protein [Tessaracoccus sp. SD287]MBO1031925.1 phage tail sheath family protein [Tessaracoccus sp. SD287]